MRYKTLAERVAARQRYRETAIARSLVMGLTTRCSVLAGEMDHPNHQLCQGEAKNGSGCLCRCHDKGFS